MTSAAVTHFVFVDFENVPEVNLALVTGKPVQVTLLIGKNQGKIDFGLVDQIHRLAAQVELVKLDASGRNALDLTLACYLGGAIERAADAHFWVVSKDKDFEPMIAHLAGKGLKVARCDNFATLPFLSKPKKTISGKSSVLPKPAIAPKGLLPAEAPPNEERLEKLVARLTHSSAPRPKKRVGLLAYINTVFGGKLTETEQNLKLDELVARGVVTIDAKDKLSYT